MNADPVNVTLAILIISLLLFTGYVAANVIVATWPEHDRPLQRVSQFPENLALTHPPIKIHVI